jgi:hypothetical protein
MYDYLIKYSYHGKSGTMTVKAKDKDQARTAFLNCMKLTPKGQQYGIRLISILQTNQEDFFND